MVTKRSHILKQWLYKNENNILPILDDDDVLTQANITKINVTTTPITDGASTDGSTESPFNNLLSELQESKT